MSKEKPLQSQQRTSPDTGGKSLVAVPVQPLTPSTGRIKRLAVFAFAFAILALALLWWGFGGGGGVSSVQTETLVPGSVKRVLAVSGRTATDINSTIVPSVSARVVSVLVREGDLVTIGDLLLVLDDTTQKSSVRQAMAALDAKILLQQAAQADRDRAKALASTVSKVALSDAEQLLQLAKSEVDRLEAALDQARIALDNYQITAPISGVVLSRSADPGDLVGPSNTLLRLANTGDLHVEVQVDEIYADDIRAGQRAQLQLAGREDVQEGVVSFVASEVDELTGSLRVKLSFDTPPMTQIGLTTIANIMIEEVSNVLTVPRSAFVKTEIGTAVFILRDGKANLVPIDFVNWPAERVQVTSGLSDGDKLVLSPEGLEDGQTMNVQNSPAEDN